ncbi:MAG: DNA-directed RNA polymerase subunit L [Candidatus Micrarchaeota archaeon]|nr:DNA-directed RNA polymerase subunit L [Candidatus Micrarchaeota archaeon]
MKLNVRTQEANYIELEIQGEDIGLPNALREILIEDKDVEFAACKNEHPQVGSPLLMLRTKTKKPLDVLESAVDKLRKEAKSFESELKSAKKAKSK